jgi:glyoxylase-like metal-dependent hydrolase (beta-lactamase superfamily II)/rhodanese-related sulfurtransferase
MIFHQLSTERGCQSYLIGCEDTCAAILIDPEISLIERYLALATKDGLIIHYILDTHTHADHFSASQPLAQKLKVPVVMHRNSPAPFVNMRIDDGEMLIVGKLKLRAIYTPGHTADSICLLLEDRIITGDTLLIGATGRTDLPSGDPVQLYDSLFNGLLKLDPNLKIFPAHDYRGQGSSTLAREMAENPRLQKKTRAEFVAQMIALDLDMPTHLTEALRINQSGGKTVAQMIADAADLVSFMSLEATLQRIKSNCPDTLILDVREHSTFEKSHLAGAINIPRGQLELRVNDKLLDPTQRIVVYCEEGQIAILAAATLREMGFGRAVALDGGMQAWQTAGYPLQ